MVTTWSLVCTICYPFAMHASQTEQNSQHQSITSLVETPLGK